MSPPDPIFVYDFCFGVLAVISPITRTLLPVTNNYFIVVI